MGCLKLHIIEEKYGSVISSSIPLKPKNTTTKNRLSNRISIIKNGTGSYRFGFDGMERDDELKGNGNSYDFGARIFDARVGRWLSVDPLQKKYPGITPYSFCFNNPLIFNDPTGEDGRITVEGNTITLHSTIWLYGKDAADVDVDNLNFRFQQLNPDRTFTDENGKTWIIKFDINFVYDENLDNALKGHGYLENVENNFSKTDISSLNLDDEIDGFEQGYNVMEINDNMGKAATTLTGWNNGFAKSDFNVLIHEVFHQLGFQDRCEMRRSFQVDHKGMHGDVLTQGGTFKDKIHPIHFVSLYNYVIKYAEGEYNIKHEGVYHAVIIGDTGHGHEPSPEEELKKAESQVKIIE